MLLLIATVLATFVSWTNACPEGCVQLEATSCMCFNVAMDAIPSGDYYGLVTLGISNSGISSLQKDSFKNYPHLRHFYLRRNPIKELDLRVFVDVAELGEIEVSSSDVERIIPLDEGQIMRQVWKLDLSKNKLTTVADNMLQGLVNRKLNFNLGGNPLVLPGDKPLLKSETLTTLDVSDTDASGISAETFSGLTVLKELDIRNASITDASQKFTSLQRLQVLCLQDNLIKEIKEDFLSKKQKLKFIQLSYGPLENIEPAAFEGKTKEAKILIYDTPYSCQCKHENIMPYFESIYDTCRTKNEDCPFNKHAPWA